jgi:hypothetical protein
MSAEGSLLTQTHTCKLSHVLFRIIVMLND